MCTLLVQSVGPQILRQFGGVVGLDTGGSAVDGVLPDWRVISGTQAVDVNVNVCLFRDCDDIILEITGVESDHVKIQIGEQFLESGGIVSFGHDFQRRTQRENAFQKTSAPIDHDLVEHIRLLKSGYQIGRSEIFAIDVDANLAVSQV